MVGNRFYFVFAVALATGLACAWSNEIDKDAARGLVAEYFALPEVHDFPDVAGRKPTFVRIDKDVNYDEVQGDFYGTHMAENFYARWTGILRIEKAGHYSLFTASDDGSRLSIDTRVIVDNGGMHSMAEKSGSVELLPGDYGLKIDFIQGGGGAACKVSWQAPGGPKEPIPARALFHKKDSEKIDWDKAAWEKNKPKLVAAHKSTGRWSEMDYGPILSSTILAGQDNIVPKGIVICVDKKNESYVCFDTELIRMSAAWTGGFIDFHGVAFDGSHDISPRPLGAVLVGTKIGPGWAHEGSFTDPREPEKNLKEPKEPKDGPLPADWAKYKGLYLNGDKVILSYTVGDCKVLELPGVQCQDSTAAFTRTFNFGTSTKSLALLVCEMDDATGGVAPAGQAVGEKKTGPADSNLALLDDKQAQTVAGLVGAPKGAEWEVAGNRILLNIPALAAPASCTLVVARISGTEAAKFTPFWKAPVEDLEALTHGGPAHWPETVFTKGVLDTNAESAAAVRTNVNELIERVSLKTFSAETVKPEELMLSESARKGLEPLGADLKRRVQIFEQTLGAQHKKGAAFDVKAIADAGHAAVAGLDVEINRPYVVDTLTAPEKNPWNSWLRFGGFDFFADGKRAALCTWSGDVWIVSGIDGKLENLSWKRFAAGLHQTLGLKIVDDTVYVLGRDQITRLHDLNNDGEADFYENFNNDCCVTTGFHEFAFDLQTDPEGNFYYSKGSPVRPGGSGFQRISAHNGCLLKISKDGSKSEVYATGFRAPNGIGVGPNGEVTTGDNEGSWTPECPINWVKKGGFYGVVDAAHRLEKPTRRDNPICWMPWKVDRSSGGQAWVTSDKWGPFKGQMLHLSYGMCSLFHVMYENIGDEIQGGVCRFPLNFASGISRARFNTADGQLYVSGIKGWQTSASRDGAFQRVRYTGKPVHMPAELHVTKTGVDIAFTNALDPASATEVDNYAVTWFNIKWSAAYGSDLYSPTDPNKKYSAKDDKAAFGDELQVKSAKLSPDGKTVSLEMPGIKPVNNMMITFKIKAADGSPISLQICNTINVMP